MRTRELIDTLLVDLEKVGVTSFSAQWSQYPAASDDDLAELVSLTKAELPEELIAWLKHITCEIPLLGNYTTVSVSNLVGSIRTTSEIDFSPHLSNIKGWKDGRFDDGRLAEAFWLPQWAPVAEDGCGNAYCVDLAPGPNGTLGQIIAMEFQDGQGPYLSTWGSLNALLEDHIAILARGAFVVTEGAIEYDL